MTQVQRILSHLQDKSPEHVTFGELYEHLNQDEAVDVPKGSLSALLSNLYKDGLVDRQLREVSNGRDLKEYQITDEGQGWLSASLAEGEKAPRKTRRRRSNGKSRRAPSRVNAATNTASPSEFTEVAKFAAQREQYENYQGFIQFLNEREAIKKNAGDADALIMEYLGVNPEAFNSQRENLESILSAVRH